MQYSWFLNSIIFPLRRQGIKKRAKQTRVRLRMFYVEYFPRRNFLNPLIGPYSHYDKSSLVCFLKGAFITTGYLLLCAPIRNYNTADKKNSPFAGGSLTARNAEILPAPGEQTIFRRFRILSSAAGR